MSEKNTEKVYTLEELFENQPDSNEIEEQPKETTSQFEASARGVGQGVSFGFADEITAALESAITGKPYRQAVEESRKAYETSAKEWPKTTLGAEFVGGAASTFIPGVGQLGRAAQIGNLAKTYKTAKAAQAALEAGALGAAGLTQIGSRAAVASARNALTKELIRGGMQTGALAGLGGAEDFADLPGTAASVATGAAIGGTLGYAVPKAIEKAAETKAGQAIGESAKKAGDIIKERLKTKRWQIPEFKTQPEKQARVDEIVRQGQKSGLTDRQILNNIAVEFKDIPTDSLEKAFKETGVMGKIKRAVAGSQEATEFIDRPEQLERAERVSGPSESIEQARKRAELKGTEIELEDIRSSKEKYRYEANLEADKLKDEIRELQRVIKLTESKADKSILQQRLTALQENYKDALKIRKLSKKIKEFKSIDEQNAKNVQEELKKASESQSSEQLQNVKNLRDNLSDQVDQLGQQRSQIVDSLDAIPTDNTDIGIFNKITEEVKDRVQEGGLGDYWSNIQKTAFTGDPRLDKVIKYNRYLSERDNYLNQKRLFDEGVPDAVKPVEPTAVPIPSKGDVVGALITANQKISSADFGSQFAKIKRKLAEIIQENMRDINPEVYQVQRQLGKTMAHVKSLEKSKFFTTAAVPITGPTGRVAPAPRKFIKTKLPDISSFDEEYKAALKDVGVNIDELTKASILEQRAAAPQERIQPRPELVQEIEQAKEAVLGKRLQDSEATIQGRIELATAIENNQNMINQIQDNLRIRKDLSRDQLRQLRAKELVLKKQQNKLREQMAELQQTEQNLRGMYEGIGGEPPTARDIGQAAVIGSKKQVPFSILKFLVPSPQKRINLFNKIKNRFQNPSLTAAVRAAIDRPITLEAVRSLSTTHKVSEPELIKTLQESGLDVFEDEQSMKALPLDSGKQDGQFMKIESEPINNIQFTEKDEYGNTIIYYADGEVQVIPASKGR